MPIDDLDENYFQISKIYRFIVGSLSLKIDNTKGVHNLAEFSIVININSHPF